MIPKSKSKLIIEVQKKKKGIPKLNQTNKSVLGHNPVSQSEPKKH
jgi:hypothetical protein